MEKARMENVPWYIMTNAPKNAELRVVPHPAFNNISVGFFMNNFLLNRIIGMKCNAPYTGNIHLKTPKKRGTRRAAQESIIGCTEGQMEYRTPKSGVGDPALARRASNSSMLLGVTSCVFIYFWMEMWMSERWYGGLYLRRDGWWHPNRRCRMSFLERDLYLSGCTRQVSGPLGLSCHEFE